MGNASWVFVRRLLGFVATALVVALVAGCGRAPAPKPGSQPQLGAHQAIDLAAKAARQVTSLAMTETMTMKLPSNALSGLAGIAGTGASGGAMGFAITMTMQLKPTLRADMTMHGHVGRHHVVLEEILTQRAIYMKLPGFKLASPARPWVEVKLTSLPAGGSLLKLAQQMSGNPMATNPLGDTALLRVAKHLRTVGSQIVAGVPTTEYAGTLSLRALSAFLPGSKGTSMGSVPAALRDSGLPFHVWIDSQHQMRQLQLGFGYRGVSMTILATITSINKPVTIAPPPASKISAIHKI